MTRTQRFTGAALILVSGILASASLHAERPRPVAQRAMETCDLQLAKDWTVCDGATGAATRRKCNENAQAKWQRCYETAGWNFSAQGQPKLPVRRPSAATAAANGGARSTAGSDAGKNQTTRAVVQSRPVATPAATPKKSSWVTPGARQTGSHMR